MKYYLSAIAAALFCILTFTAFAAAQNCPVVRVFGPSDLIKTGDKITFSVSLTGIDKVVPTYSWMISTGAISSGQGTATITVDTDDIEGDFVTATVDVGGFADKCQTTASASAEFAVKPTAILIDEFSGTNEEIEWAKLDNFTIEMTANPSAEGYILFYTGRKGKPTDFAAVKARITKYLVEMRGQDVNRFVFVNAGKREAQSIELWVTPQGATPPEPSNTIK